MTSITAGWATARFTYRSRKVGLYEISGIFVSTVRVEDGTHPYETAVEHPLYGNGEMIIVDAYDTKKEAKLGHDKWVKKMTSKKLPLKLVDCCNSFISQLVGPTVFGIEKHKAKEKKNGTR